MNTHFHKLLIVLIFSLVACEDRLDEEVFSELAPSNLLITEEGINSLLNSAYTYGHRSGGDTSWSPYYMASMPAGEVWGAGGGIESLWQALIDHNWDSNHSQIRSQWVGYYRSIRDANIVLDNLDNENFSDEFKQNIEAEVHFLRGWSYSELYNLFGAVPLYTSPGDDPLLPRATETEVQTFIEQELNLAINALPVQNEFGRGTRGAALGILAKYYLNGRQWQEAADLTQQIMDLGVYELIADYSQVFSIENEGNDELVWALPKDASGVSTFQQLNALIFPPDFPRPFPNNGVFAARTYLFDNFVNSFDVNDMRKNLIITEYVSTASGEVVSGLGNDNSFPYKIEFDPSSVGARAGNDIPIIRYADILLSRAEALNELSGPSQEVVDLINQVRTRAGIPSLNLAGFTQESLRQAIFQEREWELWFEGKAREDQIRNGTFIDRAQARGKTTAAFRALFPIPERELDANPALEQNPGY
ncbi:RagB/SusD family nutrient uptake outer membrane protein [Allomuricauda sp. SCSIO 65647]|uniref:RagB/SusD family nutrient uptake outer membrane protein n=1 Tax=Allomuricauda sp. SCSIO 65647 TaxID=2908843 RepID=UPI001F1D8CE5|nr:RagB/SusD family nutrient uptake outer membrane protein [Muricauda sp. SCSIO 65647]UJH68563.1 RagB/SusD family nutrient uptake outer membrane protein [Muricauda sp. SCSIO 65647]